MQHRIFVQGSGATVVATRPPQGNSMMHGRRDPILILEKKTNLFFTKTKQRMVG